MAKIFNKVTDVEACYSKAEGVKHEQLVEQELQLAEAQKRYEEVHKMYLLGDITEETFLTAKAEYEKQAKQVQQLKLDIGIIKKYELQDKEKNVEQIQEIERDMDKEVSAITDNAQRKVFEAKAIAEAGAEYKKAVSYKVRVIELKNKVFGINKKYLFGRSMGNNWFHWFQ